jgi:tRNA A37 threonylcarbamoyladenosine biosynthesis protein TsaE
MSVDQGWEVLRHYDLYHIQSDEDLRALRIIPRLTPHMLACIEWPGRMSGVITDTELATCQVVKITLRVGSSEKREIGVEI